MHTLQLDAGECADGSAGTHGMGVGSRGGLDVDICDISDEDVRGVELERRDVEVLEDKLDLGVFIFDPVA